MHFGDNNNFDERGMNKISANAEFQCVFPQPSQHQALQPTGPRRGEMVVIAAANLAARGVRRRPGLGRAAAFFEKKPGDSSRTLGFFFEKSDFRAEH